MQWYGERGIVNALVNHLSRGLPSVDPVRSLLSAIRWAAPRGRSWIGTFTRMIVELGTPDFGNPDLLLVCDGPDGVRLVFLAVEAKVAPYLASMRPNSQGMTLPRFKSRINGQLSLKYRFARALEAAPAGVLVL